MSNLLKYIIIPLVLFFFAIAVIFWVLLPLWNDTQSALELRKSNAENLAQREKLAANLRHLIGQYNERASDFVSFSQAIPSGQNIPELLVNLEALASENGLFFSGVDFKPQDSGNPKIKALQIDIKLKGSYPNFQNYVKAMEKSLRLFDIVAVSFNGIRPGEISVSPDKLEFNLSVNTYYQ